jgi:3-hydroxyacyl-CoA dehydrogenase
MAIAYDAHVETAAVVGLGTIGMSWSAYFVARGIAVQATDVDPRAETRARDFIDRAICELEHLGLVVPTGAARFTFHETIEDAVDGVSFVQENGPENEDIKIELLARIDRALEADVPVASSTSALMMSTLQQSCRHPGRCFVGHPFNPPHLIPLVEIVGGKRTDPHVLDWAQAFYRRIGREPIRLRREVYGHVANRLQYVLFNEAARLLLEGVATVEDIDAAVSFGPGMRWAFFGPFMTMHLGGGAEGIRGSFRKFAGRDAHCTDRAARMSLSDEQRRTLIDGVEAASEGHTIAALEARRDALLRELYRLKINGQTNS